MQNPGKPLTADLAAPKIEDALSQSVHQAAAAPGTGDALRAPGWLMAATGALALTVLALALAETNLWMHFLIDAGESISLAGLAFIAVAGLFLFRARRLSASLPLALPWLLFPVITQGDQLIDNLSINWMRFIVHLLLAAIFGIPVVVAVMAARLAARSPRAWHAAVPGLAQIAAGRVREGRTILAALLLALEMPVAVRYLGELMVATLVVMIWATLAIGFGRAPGAGAPRRSERAALALLLAGVTVSLALFVGYKNRPGAYQGSPSYFMDPNQKDAGFRLDAVPVPRGPAQAPRDPQAVRSALTRYAQAFDRLLAGYYILDRNYNYDFHNRLFVRSTPLLADYRRVGLIKVHEAETMRADADTAATHARATLAENDPLTALLDDVRAYAAFTFGRTPVLERMTAEFVRTEAGLQHATHLYEGEGKVLGVRLAEILDKHAAVLTAPAATAAVSEFVSISRSVHDAYANRIVGF
jgi:hypothetical protein